MVTSILPLKLEEATVRKGGSRILGPLDLTLDGEGCTILLGPNGAGKTTLLRLLHGLDRTSGGQARWATPREEAYLRQSFVFQSPVVMRRSVRDNIAYPLLVRGVGRKEARERAVEWIAHVGLAGADDKPAQILSGGEKQKLAIARALIIKPEVLFLDEPAANLDGTSTRDIEALILRAARAGTRIVMATHNFGQARRLADDILFIYRGRIHERGPAKEFFAGPETKEAETFIKGDLLL
ncbi:MAG: ATP-binding cassette domain-containing protein [Alphaproteobacteria bacterium]|nr:MAG: ATP-binding cassette domain-containing protein [Alphaproteobacteria bacterium]